MKFAEILNESWWLNQQKKLYDPTDLTFSDRQVKEDEVHYDITYAKTGKKIGTYTFWAVHDLIFIDRKDFKLPDKSLVLPMMGIIPIIVMDYIQKGYGTPDVTPREFKLDLETQIQSKRFKEYTYYYYVTNTLNHKFRFGAFNDEIRIWYKPN